MLIYPLGIDGKVAEIMPMVQHSLPGQAVESDLLGIHRQESVAGSCHQIQRYFQAMQCACRFSFYSDEKGLYAAPCFPELRW